MRQLLIKSLELLEVACRPPERQFPGAGFLAWLLVLLFCWFYLGTVLINESNLNRLSSDQQYNIELAGEMHADWYPHRTKGVVNPLWPWLIAKVGYAGSDADIYTRGRWINLILCGVFIAGLALILRRYWGDLPALLLAGIGGFGALLARAVYFQPEPIYYLLSFAAWALMLVSFWRNPWWLLALIGLLAGFAYLAKSVMTPMLAAYFVFSGGLAMLALMIPKLTRGRLPAGWQASRQVFGLTVLALCYATVIAPLAWYNNDRFGSPFHSWPSYWMWQDDFGSESIPFMAAHPNAAALAAIPEDEVPSLGNYIATHSSAEMLERLTTGMAARLHEFFYHEGKVQERDSDKPWKSVLRYRGCYLSGLLLLVAVLAMAAWRNRLLAGQWLPAIVVSLFVVAVFSGYWLAFGWYYQIGRGPRFMLGLYLPLVFALLAGSVRLHQQLVAGNSSWRYVFPAAAAMLAIMLLLRLAELLVNPHFVD